jgi:hypothetical protein
MIPVKTIHGEGYVLYVKDGDGWENDIFCVVDCQTGELRHYNTRQISIHENHTYEISNRNQQ